MVSSHAYHWSSTANPTGRDRTPIPKRNKQAALYYSSKRKKDFLPAWQQPSQSESVTTLPLRNHRHLELSLSFNGLFFKAAPPNFLFFKKNSSFL